MKEKPCKLCQTPFTDRGSFCSREHALEWDRNRKNKDWENRPEVEVTCQNESCKKVFITRDKRKKACSNKCTYAVRAVLLQKRYGWSNPSEIQKTKEEKEKTIIKRTMTYRERYGDTGDKFVKSKGYDSFESFGNKVVEYIEKHKCSPYSNRVLSEFQCSTQIIKNIIDKLNRHDLVHNRELNSDESEIYEYLCSIVDSQEIEKHAHPDFLNGMELDFYLPKYKLAIEYHGLFSHSERFLFKEESKEKREKRLHKIKTQHEKKYIVCKTQGIKLIQIFEDEWHLKKDILKSMIKNRLGLMSNKLFGRGVVFREVNKDEAFDFFEKNHISGGTRAIVTFGLYSSEQGDLLCALSIRRPWQGKKYGGNTLEIARFASKLDYQIVGGFSKLLKGVKKWAKGAGYDKMLTFSDCRFGSGKVYLDNGFEYLGKTTPNYFYEKAGKRENRFKHRHDPKFPGTE
jgi:G:T-mismatch repair DNA endonuclease (very short patch repair protein)